MKKPIFTAVSMMTRQTNNVEDVEDDLQSMMTQPLLLNDDDDDDDDCCDNTIVVFQTKTNKATQTTTKSTNTTTTKSTTATTTTSCHSSRFVLFGTVTGFAIQVISLGAYALLLLHYSSSSGSMNDSATTTTATLTPPSWPGITAINNHSNHHHHSILSLDWFVYGLLSVLTQIDLVLYVVIWIAFTCTMTSGGMQCLKLQFQSQQPSNTTTTTTTTAMPQQLTRRTVFVWGVYFLVGIVLGAFGAWSVIDVYLGFPIPFLPIVATVGIDLVLCYLMVCCYDLGRTSSSGSGRKSADEDDDDDEDECICC